MYQQLTDHSDYNEKKYNTHTIFLFLIYNFIQPIIFHTIIHSCLLSYNLVIMHSLIPLQHLTYINHHILSSSCIQNNCSFIFLFVTSITLILPSAAQKLGWREKKGYYLKLKNSLQSNNSIVSFDKLKILCREVIKHMFQ